MLPEGAEAPDFTLPDQNGDPATLSDLRGAPVVLYFYPRADTPGCTAQACGVRDHADAYEAARVTVMGVSPDPHGAVARFAEKYSLRFPLLADEDHAVAEAYDVWTEKKNYGRTYMGIIRSAFLVDEKGKVEEAWYKVSPKATAENLLKAIGK